MAYETNRFCWHGLISKDSEKSKAFYGEVLGWKTETMQMGGDSAEMFVVADVPMAHMREPHEGEPSFWNNYLRVEDVDASTKSAVDNGGKQLAPPMDIPPGRFSVVQSPSGAVFSLFHEADVNTAQHHPGGLGSVHWVELHSQDLDKDLQWLKQTFNYELGEMPMPDGTYHLLNYGDHPRGGAMKAMMAEAPSMWLTWFSVDNCDAALTRVNNNGGKAFGEPMTMDGIGKMFVAADPQGAVFGIIEPTEK